MAEVRYGGLPFKEAVEFFRQKVRLPTRAWTDITHGMHTRAFVVAGATRDELLADFQASLLEQQRSGISFKAWQKDFDRIVAKHGWAYRGERGWRSRVIFETNLRTAYAAGRYKQLTDPDLLRARPFWRYRHGDSRVPRPHHLAWDGLILRADDPWWRTHFPPNGWGCSCFVEALAPRDLRRLGKKGADQAPPLALEERTLGRGGPAIMVPRGIDPGWAYNVGEAAWGRNEALRLLEDEGPWRELAMRGAQASRRPARVALDRPRAKLERPVAKGAQLEYAAALRRALERAVGMPPGADSVELVDPTGAPVLVTQALVDHMLADPARQDGREARFALLRELVEEPFEIWVGFAQSEMSGRVALRRRYVKAFELAGEVVLGLAAELDKGHLAALESYDDLRDLEALRRGRLLWGRS